MPIVTAAIIGGVASMAGSALASEGQKDANEANRDAAARSNEFNSAEAVKNREFQERMSNTSYQRAMSDMRSAGLNPILAASRGGASTPSGSSASAVPQSPNLNTMAPYADTAMKVAQIAHTSASARQADAQVRNLDADTANKQAQQPYFAGQSGHQDALVRNLDANTNLSKEQAHRVGYEVVKIISETQLTRANEERVYEEIKNAIAENRRINAHTGNLQADSALKSISTKLQHLLVPEAEGKAGWHKRYPEMSIERNFPDTGFKDVGRIGMMGSSAVEGLFSNAAQGLKRRYESSQGLKGPTASGKIRW